MKRANAKRIALCVMILIRNAFFKCQFIVVSLMSLAELSWISYVKRNGTFWILCFFFISAWKKKCCIDRKLQAVIKIFFYLFVSSLSSSKTSLHTIYIHTEKKRKKRFDSIIWHNTIIIIQNDVRIYQIVIFIVIIFTKERLSCLKDRSN